MRVRRRAPDRSLRNSQTQSGCHGRPSAASRSPAVSTETSDGPKGQRRSFCRALWNGRNGVPALVMRARHRLRLRAGGVGKPVEHAEKTAQHLRVLGELRVADARSAGDRVLGKLMPGISFRRRRSSPRSEWSRGCTHGNSDPALRRPDLTFGRDAPSRGHRPLPGDGSAGN